MCRTSRLLLLAQTPVRLCKCLLEYQTRMKYCQAERGDNDHRPVTDNQYTFTSKIFGADIPFENHEGDLIVEESPIEPLAQFSNSKDTPNEDC